MKFLSSQSGAKNLNSVEKVIKKMKHEQRIFDDIQEQRIADILNKKQHRFHPKMRQKDVEYIQNIWSSNDSIVSNTIQANDTSHGNGQTFTRQDHVLDCDDDTLGCDGDVLYDEDIDYNSLDDGYDESHGFDEYDEFNEYYEDYKDYDTIHDQLSNDDDIYDDIYVENGESFLNDDFYD